MKQTQLSTRASERKYIRYKTLYLEEEEEEEEEEKKQKQQTTLYISIMSKFTR